jgi:hypothetical protein
MSFITKRRLASVASASTLVATMAVASLPGATLAAEPTSGPTGFFRDGKELTAKQIGGVATGNVDATGYDIAVYNPTSVTNADIHGATYYGVVVNGTTVDTTNSKVHEIGDHPLSGAQHGNAILYINGARGTISGNQVYDFQKNGITVSGKAADGVAPSTGKTSATVQKNVVTGEGHISYIAQNGIQISYGASATVKNNTVNGIYYTPEANEACGLLLYEHGAVTASGNKFADVELTIYPDANRGGHVKP